MSDLFPEVQQYLAQNWPELAGAIGIQRQQVQPSMSQGPIDFGGASDAVLRQPEPIEMIPKIDPMSQTPAGYMAKLQEAVRSTLGGPLENVDAPLKALEAMTVFHGSPHKFDKFLLDKIGTGEGAQAYGHGLYFAENPETAKVYANTLGSVEAKIGGKTFKADKYTFMDKMLDAYKQYGKEGAKNSLKQEISTLEGTGPYSINAIEDASVKSGKTDLLDIRKARLPRVKEALAALESGEIEIKQNKNLYHVDLPDEHIEKMLDWDKPLSEQPESIKKIFPTLDEAKSIDAELESLADKALKAGTDSPETAAFDALYKSPKAKLAKIILAQNNPKLYGKFQGGEDIYRALSDALGGKEKASEYLKSLGIPGIKYLDQGSRTTGKGTRNFVVFDENIVKVLKRE
jgi:hypothetical protein